MEDIEPGESISQIGFGEGESRVSSSRPSFGGLTASDSGFRSRFGSQKDFWEKFLIITNDPVTLMRSKAILEVRTL